MFYKIQFIFYRKKNTVQQDIFNDLILFIKQLPDWKEKPSQWLIAHPTKTLIAIDNGEATSDARSYIEVMMLSKKAFNIVLADEDKDNSILTIWLMNTPTVSDNRYYLTLTITSLSHSYDKDTFINLIGRFLCDIEWDFKFILLDTEQYKLNQKSVFEDRLPVGWMLYLPVKIKHEDIQSAYEIYNIPSHQGSIVISKEVFDGGDKGDIACANNVEIELAAHGLLPLIKDL